MILARAAGSVRSPEVIAADTCEAVAAVADVQTGGRGGDISPIRSGKTRLYVRSR